MDTDQLIKRLAADLRPVKPLRSPSARAVLWIGMALPCVAAVVWGKHLMPEPALVGSDTRFIIEQAATLATALTAAIAAFSSVIPGHDWRIMLLPLGPLGLWLASVSHGCVQDWVRFGADGLTIRPDWDCLPTATIIGIIPAVALVLMLRRGAPLNPRLTLALAVLAVASLGNFGLQFAHARDVSIMVLVWHLGALAVLSALGGWLGERILGWGPVPSLVH